LGVDRFGWRFDEFDLALGMSLLS
jgi:hypothetical protein